MSKYSDMRAEFAEMANNHSLRIMMCICIDSSFSMRHRMDTINQGILDFLENLSKNKLAVDASEISIISFGENVSRKCEYGKVDQAIRAVRANGGIQAQGTQTRMGSAIKSALQQLDERQAKLSSVGIKFYTPWLILISDGKATDPDLCEKMQKEVSSRLKNGTLKTKCLSMGNEQNSLKDFTIDGHVDKLEDLHVMEFFSMLSRSISQASRASIQGGDFDLLDKNKVFFEGGALWMQK